MAEAKRVKPDVPADNIVLTLSIEEARKLLGLLGSVNLIGANTAQMYHTLSYALGKDGHDAILRYHAHTELGTDKVTISCGKAGTM